NVFFLIALLALLNATLTLPGIAGIVLTVGMAVDANIIIFERIREEMRKGATGRGAIESGFSKAHWTILDANITTLLTGIILYAFGTGPVRGFAVTLCLGILTSVFTALFVARLGFDVLKLRRADGSLSI
ncbi:MAG: MMPL family transporter, partial [Bdellovibrionales bacterium]|nr:MMPL family transporter [Bdellovibrionales bacterium]